MQIFEYVVVLTSIVIGLAVTHIMQGIARLVQHPGRARIWWVHLGWVVFWLFTSVFWWWWEFHLQTVGRWTFQLYLFVIAYAFMLYLISALLLPRDLEGYDGYKDYFLSRRGWLFGVMLLTAVMDVVDTLAKGYAHFAAQGFAYIAIQGTLAVVCCVGMSTRREWVHAVLVVIALTFHVTRAIALYGTLA